MPACLLAPPPPFQDFDLDLLTWTFQVNTSAEEEVLLLLLLLKKIAQEKQKQEKKLHFGLVYDNTFKKELRIRWFVLVPSYCNTPWATINKAIFPTKGRYFLPWCSSIFTKHQTCSKYLYRYAFFGKMYCNVPESSYIFKECIFPRYFLGNVSYLIRYASKIGFYKVSHCIKTHSMSKYVFYIFLFYCDHDREHQS